ncbi:hypothetical protein EV175_005694 [Coemansia sp. RSA 1933]|nr:hypothetical protein EV175_005694 [Coemansia sp. RSA 1933]
MSSSPPPQSSYSRAQKKSSRIPAPPRRERAADTQKPINYHSRSAAREQLRKRQQGQGQGHTGGGVMADINTLHGQQQNRDTTTAMHSAFVSGPLDSLSTSAYVSGHLTPSDQWVAIGNESSSGVISLTSTDTEDEPPDSAVGSNDDNGTKREGKQVAAAHISDQQGAGFLIPVDAQYYQQQKPLSQHSSGFANYPQPQQIALNSSASRWDPEYDDPEEQQAVHLLRESVASLLSSGGGGTASSAASSALSGNPTLGVPGGSRRKGSSRIRSSSSKMGGGSGAYYRQSHSPSNVSKISEPCYHPSSEPRRQVTANFDHFSDIALSTTTATPPPYYNQHGYNRHKHDRLQAAGDSGGRHGNAHFPTYEEFKRQQRTQSAQNSISPSVARRQMNAADSADADTIVPMSPSLGKQKPFAHPFLSEQSDGYSLFLSNTVSRPLSPTTAAAAATTGKRSPFSSIRTVSPIIVHRPVELDGDAAVASEIIVQRAQAEAALEQTIHCPVKSFSQFGAEFHRPARYV